MTTTDIAAGLYYLRCQDRHTAYFPGIPSADDTWRQQEQYARRQAERFGRLAEYSLDKDNREKYRRKEKEWKKAAGYDSIGADNTNEVVDVHSVGRIDREIYKCVTEDIITDEVIITDERIRHIKDRHPNDFERFSSYFEEIIKNPDYILKANKPNTAIVLKEIIDNGEKFQLILRLATNGDNPNFKNSIITFLKINERTWNKYLRNKEILYKNG